METFRRAIINEFVIQRWASDDNMRVESVESFEEETSMGSHSSPAAVPFPHLFSVTKASQVSDEAESVGRDTSQVLAFAFVTWRSPVV